jgi:two-component system, LytTR family, response regulator
MIRVIIADDEPLAREKTSLFVKNISDLEVAAVCENGNEAIAACKHFHPDLLLLDIQMPEVSGFDVVQRLSPENIPGIIFVTAYDEFALQAFEYHAIDYLLKPFDFERFYSAINRARTLLQTNHERNSRDAQMKMLLDSIEKKEPPLNRLVVKTDGRIIFLKIGEIDWMEAAGNYIKLHVGSESYLVRATMNNIEKQLDPEKFLRIHRSSIINIERIKELRPWFNGDYKVVLNGNEQLVLSKGYRSSFNKLVGKAL